MTLCRSLSVFLLTVMLCFGHSLHAQTEGNRAVIEILSLQHRDPLLVRSQIRPQLDPRGHIGQIDNKLVIATTAANLQELRSLINQIDVPPRRLVVSVDFDFNNRLTDSSQSVQALEGEQLRLVQSTQPVTQEPEQEQQAPLPDQLQASTDTQAGAEIISETAIWLQADIRDNQAQLQLELLNVDGFTGRHPLTLDLGVWMTLNETATLTDPDLEVETDSQTAPAPVIAIRVDVLP
ncbi:hypothetical protein [Pseudohongiella spirulinae]|uniref:NolW-like domain-containing protein n=1 Tax=Pseudohongiella spirulinae TaxID=1249552 RepID=A0A0S2KE25_9GAMM|nr:hypothetical protein [Pseudohongiella spirulinae]ALO46226.1 hypothetical protein PS2015_1572 [Pseudohongiella spirulinae]